MKYLVATNENDGWGYGSNQWEDHHEFPDFESLVEFLAEIEFAKRNRDEIRVATEQQEVSLRWRDPDEIEAGGVFQLIDDSFEKELSEAIERQVVACRRLFEKDKVDTAEKQRASKERRRRDKEEAERRRYEELRAKYGGDSDG